MKEWALETVTLMRDKGGTEQEVMDIESVTNYDIAEALLLPSATSRRHFVRLRRLSDIAKKHADIARQRRS